MSGISCNKVNCDHNTGFTHECMFGVDEDTIRVAKDRNSNMCNTLRVQVLLSDESVVKESEE